jgi:tetratricopeptide (TPR) repeat protein
MEPHNGLYYYGRARVYLLADDTEKALEDFKKAAELDDEDAQRYINTIAKTQ